MQSQMSRFPFVVHPRRVIQLVHCSNHASYTTKAQSPLASPPPRTSSLSGTVPHHTSYLLLHSSQPPDKWPSVFLSPLYMDLQRRIKQHGGLVNFCWQAVDTSQDVLRIGRYHGETYDATLWRAPPRGGLARRIKLTAISANTLEEILGELFSDNSDMGDEVVPEPSFYVCTHANRDCRCGVRGGEFAESLRKELSNRGMLLDRTGNSRVYEVGHVGGHKNAPNIIVLPQGDWYGNLEPSDIPALLDHWLRPLQRPPTAKLPDGPNILQWRGRMGMTREDQVRAAEDKIYGN